MPCHEIDHDGFFQHRMWVLKEPWIIQERNLERVCMKLDQVMRTTGSKLLPKHLNQSREGFWQRAVYACECVAGRWQSFSIRQSFQGLLVVHKVHLRTSG